MLYRSVVVILLGFSGCSSPETTQIEQSPSPQTAENANGEAKEESYPSVVAISLCRLNRSCLQSCTGTLIARDVILTAAHCFYQKDERDGPNAKLNFPLDFISVSPYHDSNQKRGVRHVSIQRWQSSRAFLNDDDIALAFLDTPVDLIDGKVETMKVNSGDPINTCDRVDSLGLGNSAYGSGFLSFSNGEARVYKDVSVHSYSFCESHQFSHPLSRHIFCFNADRKQKLCYGDSGGPVYHGNTLVGVNSFVTDADCILGTAYATRVDPYVEWMWSELKRHSNIKELSGPDVFTKWPLKSPSYLVEGSRCEEWQCKSGQCLSHEQVCDGIPQCDDGSDEDDKYCKGYTPTTAECKAVHGYIGDLKATCATEISKLNQERERLRNHEYNFEDDPFIMERLCHELSHCRIGVSSPLAYSSLCYSQNDTENLLVGENLHICLDLVPGYIWAKQERKRKRRIVENGGEHLLTMFGHDKCYA